MTELLTDDPRKGECCEELFDLELVPACAPSYDPEENKAFDADFESSTLIIHRQIREAWNQWFRKAGVELQQTPNIFELHSIKAVVQSAELRYKPTAIIATNAKTIGQSAVSPAALLHPVYTRRRT